MTAAQGRPHGDATLNHRVVVVRHGGPEVLALIEEPLPEPAADEVRVRVQAAGVSAYDLMHRRSGRLPGTPKVPFTLGEDVVGEVDAVGARVTELVPGQRVAAATWSRGSGGYTEYICLPASDFVPAPFFPTLDKLARTDPAWYRDTLGELLDLLADRVIRPIVAERVPLAQAARAHELLERGGHRGKVVLVTDIPD